jgi:hypothetical protein
MNEQNNTTVEHLSALEEISLNLEIMNAILEARASTIH